MMSLPTRGLLGLALLSVLALVLADGPPPQGGMGGMGGMDSQVGPQEGAVLLGGNATNMTKPCCKTGMTNDPPGCHVGAPPSCKAPCCTNNTLGTPPNCSIGQPPACLAPGGEGGGGTGGEGPGGGGGGDPGSEDEGQGNGGGGQGNQANGNGGQGNQGNQGNGNGGGGDDKPPCCREGTDEPDGCTVGSPPDCKKENNGNGMGSVSNPGKDRKEGLLGGGNVQCPKADDGAGPTCSGTDAGACVFRNETKDGVQYQVGRCECNAGFFPPVCSSAAEIEEKNEERGAIVQATQGKAKKEKERKEKCSGGDKSFLCPDDPLLGALSDTCQTNMQACFNGNTTAAAEWGTRQTARCDGGQTFCDIDGCVQQGTVCSPMTQVCPNNRKFRCADWTCAANRNQCPVSNTSACPDPDLSVLCPDGRTCAKNHGQCVRQGITWEGCEGGKMECTGLQGVCVEEASQCEAQGGCPEGKVFCGARRDDNGRVMWNEATNKPMPKCLDACSDNARKPEITSGEMRAERGKKIEAKAADGVVAAALQVFVDNAFRRADNGTGAINFTFSPVPDSLINNGAFSEYVGLGAIVSTLIQVEPSAELVIVGGFLLEIPITGAGDNETLCNLIVIENNLQMLKVPDITNISANTELAGKCSRGPSAACTCGVNITHFSTYGVVAGSIVSEATTVRTTDDTTPPGSSPTFSLAARTPIGFGGGLVVTALMAMAASVLAIDVGSRG